MRIAVLIIGLLLGLLMFLQTVLVYAGASATEQDDLAGAAAVGVFMALLWLVACALVIAFPMISVVLFVLAGVFGFAAGASSDFADLPIWGGVSLVLAAMSFFGWRGKKRSASEAAAERQRQFERDERLESLIREQRSHPVASPAQQPMSVSGGAPARQNFCTSCGARNEPGSRFCGECGVAMASVAFN
jgi:hypothetical protein